MAISTAQHTQTLEVEKWRFGLADHQRDIAVAPSMPARDSLMAIPKNRSTPMTTIVVGRMALITRKWTKDTTPISTKVANWLGCPKFAPGRR
jgi:hypothetical protein